MESPALLIVFVDFEVSFAELLGSSDHLQSGESEHERHTRLQSSTVKESVRFGRSCQYFDINFIFFLHHESLELREQIEIARCPVETELACLLSVHQLEKLFLHLFIFLHTDVIHLQGRH